MSIAAALTGLFLIILIGVSIAAIVVAFKLPETGPKARGKKRTFLRRGNRMTLCVPKYPPKYKCIIPSKVKAAVKSA